MPFKKLGSIALSLFLFGSVHVQASATSAGFSTIADETQARADVTAEARQAWNNNDFNTLDTLAEKYGTSKAKTPSGKWKLAVFDDTLSTQLRIDWPDSWNVPEAAGRPQCKCNAPLPDKYQVADYRWELVHQKILSWIKQNPSSTYSQIALAHYLKNRGWFYRGNGFTDSVPDVAWPIFRTYVHQASLTLEQIKWKGKPNPVWFSSMADIAISDQYPKDKSQQLLKRLNKEGSSYPTAYLLTSRNLLPKWGGTYEAFDQFARAAMKQNDGRLEKEMYVRIYWNVAAEIGNIFSVGKADWPTVKQGFDEILAKYPSYKNLNGKAMFACQANDATTYRDTMKLLGDQLDPMSWGENYSWCKSAMSLERLSQ